MVMLNENTIEDFIRDNKEKFEVYRPPENHLDRFFFKLRYRLRHIISILPYLVRVAAATIIIFIASLVVWNNFIRKDRNEISLREKVTQLIRKVNPEN
jgi:hypothetical protein